MDCEKQMCELNHETTRDCNPLGQRNHHIKLSQIGEYHDRTHFWIE